MREAVRLQDRWQKLIPLLTSTAFILVLDQVTKLLVRTNLDLGQSSPQEGFLRFTYVQNDGAAFGISLPEGLLLLLTPIAVLAMGYLYLRYVPSHNLIARISLGMIIGGSLGNLIDRLIHEYVTDFIDVRLWGDYHWPAFNVADATVVIGVVLLGYFMLTGLNQPDQDQ